MTTAAGEAEALHCMSSNKDQRLRLLMSQELRKKESVLAGCLHDPLPQQVSQPHQHCKDLLEDIQEPHRREVRTEMALQFCSSTPRSYYLVLCHCMQEKISKLQLAANGKDKDSGVKDRDIARRDYCPRPRAEQVKRQPEVKPNSLSPSPHGEQKNCRSLSVTPNTSYQEKLKKNFSC
ncbi:uncharacterized protein [Struthio camelus]|uniref:uncharacterized protein isoform X2 n=1 Tax=Struthio camelus TaxID=8801 RepID=UPI003603EB18